ncbi:hypothetical protein [Paraburkholderia ferrariae]|uniref:hypothetical protein n=1 Tax=Paraburkholderia ferrariae TaxID=386056 RepID=UPI0012EC46B7|nr:hypothetical protein [Paraburkholderia ferrariae]
MKWIGRSRRINAIKTRSRWQQSADWLEQSTGKKLLVAIAALIGFTLSTAQAGWSVYKQYQESRLVETIRIEGRTSYPIVVPASMDQVLAITFPEPDGTIKLGPRTPMPYYPVDLVFQNPTSRRISLSDCKLRIHFFQRKVAYESLSYLVDKDLRPTEIIPAPNVTVDSGETVQVRWRFFFLPTPDFTRLLQDKQTQATQFEASCVDERGGLISSQKY